MIPRICCSKCELRANNGLTDERRTAFGPMAERREVSMQDDCGLVERNERKRIDEAIRLVAAFMRVRDRKARAEIIKLAEQCAAVDPGESIVRFGG